MYPINYFALFPPFPREHKVFVAMSFDPRFNSRWVDVIAPAIRAVSGNNVPLEPYRVDTRRVSDSILTEILGGVSNHRLVFADITSISHLDGRPIRNGNVMYEVGLAHAIRLPEEVLLFRSDSDPLLFDVANIRLNIYDPDGKPEDARQKVRDVIIEALREVDLKRNLAVRATAEALDYTSWMLLATAVASNGVEPPPTKTMGQALANAASIAAIQRLLNLGALATTYITVTAEFLTTATNETPGEKALKYHVTPFGMAILEHVAHRMGLASPELRPLMEQLSSTVPQGPE
jgi:hypothetical protein